MSGHSKWSTIKHKKAAQDSKRGKLFGQLSRQIRVAVKDGGGGDPTQNPQLRLAIDKARGANMPNANIDRAIQRGMGKSASGAALQEVVYEGYGPGGVGVMIWVVTDNRNRTGAEIRSALEKSGGSLGSPGSAGYMFELNNDDGEVTVKIPLPVTDPSQRAQVDNLVDRLEEMDDVEMVSTNMSEAS